MKKLLCFLVAACLFLLPAAAHAEDFAGTASDLGSSSPHPPVVRDAEVAMIYWQLARKTPNFDAMAKASEEYKKAGDFDRNNVLAAKKADLQNVFDNVNFSHPTVVGMAVHLSNYSEKNKGFVITDFEEQTFFKYSIGGENYAIVPRGLMDHQFLGPIDDTAIVRKIMGAKDAFHNVFHLMIYLKPDFADPPEQLSNIDGQNFHIISGQVAHVALYDGSDAQQLWGDNSDDFNKAQQDQLMNLKQ